MASLASFDDTSFGSCETLVCLRLGAAVKMYQELGGLKQQTCIVLQFLSLEV